MTRKFLELKEKYTAFMGFTTRDIIDHLIGSYVKIKQRTTNE